MTAGPKRPTKPRIRYMHTLASEWDNLSEIHQTLSRQSKKTFTLYRVLLSLPAAFTADWTAYVLTATFPRSQTTQAVTHYYYAGPSYFSLTSGWVQSPNEKIVG